MLLFFVAVSLLVAGYFLYGRLTASSVAPDPARVPPAIAMADGVDYVVIPTWRVFLIQLLNIAGLGPVYGAIMGALFGPQVFLWVVLGCILGGAVHDFVSGAMSVRNGGAGLPELIGRYMGNVARHAATIFIAVLVVLVGTVFVKGPALLVAQILPATTVGGWLGGDATQVLTSRWQGEQLWLWVVMAAIFFYYVLATMLPIDKLIGRIYPLFAVALLVMVGGLTVAIATGRLHPPSFTFANLHPAHLPAWPTIFITVSCGAVSGFHATQSPLMARCLKTEKHMQVVFYGAMIAEGLIAVVWAAAAQGYYGSTANLAAVLGAGGPGTIVHDVCIATMGTVGGVLAVLGVIVLPITSGDTAFRAARLILADYLHLPQSKVINRYLIAIPLFGVSVVLNFVKFNLIWRYFGWANQTLAAVTLWAAAVYLAKRGRMWWLAALPATFMTVVTTSYILIEKVGLALPHATGVWLGTAVGVVALGWFLIVRPKLTPEVEAAPAAADLSAGERESSKVAL